MQQIRGKFLESLLNLDQRSAMDIALKAVESQDGNKFIEGILTPSLNTIGEGWSSGEYALSQVYMSGRICEQIMETILPKEANIQKNYLRVAITTLNDFHVLGKRIVFSMLRAAGFHVEDFGRTSSQELVNKVLERKIDILLISTLMLNSAYEVKNVVNGLRMSQAQTKVVVGGAVFRLDQDLWKEVGADCMGKTASDAINIVADYNKSGV